MRFIIIMLFTSVLISCAPIHVSYDFDKTTQFANYITYNYYSDMQTGLSELDTKRFLDALDANMAIKGFRLSDTPDFFIDIKSKEFQEVQRQTVGVGLGGGGGNMGGGISIGLPIGQTNVNRQLIIEFVDDNKKQLFWQAVSEYSFKPNMKPEQREEKFSAITEKVLSKYPPTE